MGARWGEGGMEGGQKRGHHDPHQHSCSPPISCSPPKSVSLACRCLWLAYAAGAPVSVLYGEGAAGKSVFLRCGSDGMGARLAATRTGQQGACL